MKELSNTLMEKLIVSSPIIDLSPLSGGSISDVNLATLENQSKIIIKKVNDPKMLEAEALGLKSLGKTKTIPVPEVIYLDSNLMVLEYLNPGHPSLENWFTLGENLAKLHLNDQDELFGFHQDNFIGSTAQINIQRSNEWSEFFLTQRLQYQINLTNIPDLNNLFQDKRDNIKKHISNSSLSPSLVHGDLWSGNAFFNQEGVGYVIDPAVYYGDGEVDLAMTELFGGFPKEFYEGYESLKPLSANYPIKKRVYNLYHVINHHNLFGGGYLGQAIKILMTL